MFANHRSPISPSECHTPAWPWCSQCTFHCTHQWWWLWTHYWSIPACRFQSQWWFSCPLTFLHCPLECPTAVGLLRSYTWLDGEWQCHSKYLRRHLNFIQTSKVINAALNGIRILHQISKPKPSYTETAQMAIASWITDCKAKQAIIDK